MTSNHPDSRPQGPSEGGPPSSSTNPFLRRLPRPSTSGDTRMFQEWPDPIQMTGRTGMRNLTGTYRLRTTTGQETRLRNRGTQPMTPSYAETNPYYWNNNPLMPLPYTVLSPDQPRTAWQEAAPSYYILVPTIASWLHYSGGYAGNMSTRTPTPMPELPPFLNAFKSEQTIPTTSTTTTTNSPENSSRSPTEGERTPLIQIAPTTSGQISPLLIGRSSVSPDQMPGTSDDTMLRNEPLMESLGPMNPWISTSSSTKGSVLMQRAQPLSNNDSPQTGTDPYLPQPQATDSMGYVPVPTMNRGPWNTPSPIWSAGRYPMAPARNDRVTFHFDEETFGSAIRDGREDPGRYWGPPIPLPDSPPVRHGRFQGRGI